MRGMGDRREWESEGNGRAKGMGERRERENEGKGRTRGMKGKT
jgi:hypothetical protein